MAAGHAPSLQQPSTTALPCTRAPQHWRRFALRTAALPVPLPPPGSPFFALALPTTLTFLEPLLPLTPSFSAGTLTSSFIRERGHHSGMLFNAMPFLTSPSSSFVQGKWSHFAQYPFSSPGTYCVTFPSAVFPFSPNMCTDLSLIPQPLLHTRIGKLVDCIIYTLPRSSGFLSPPLHMRLFLPAHQ